ncbi:MAG TPA: glycoside hydrolase family 2 protein [Thermoanaerobaculia bacterium]|nr:glycoside hydrolase family 2 protein [Thermoanaerobaculia bacterium]
MQWQPATVPGTVAQAIGGGSELDDRDWWYRATFDGTGEHLIFSGLATLAQVWLNGELVLESRNMFERHVLDVRQRLQSENELVICFRSLNAALAQRRPRPRWKTRLVRNQQLRWFRTSLLGRIPGWTPPIVPVGPWRSIELGTWRDIEIATRLDGTTGVVEFSCLGTAGTVTVGSTTAELQRSGDRLSAQLRIENAAVWWPHTHGEPALHDCAAVIDGQSIDCGSLGFRTIEEGPRVNGAAVFSRGACWTIEDITSLTGDYRQTLTLLREAGANMIRIGGTMVYEADELYRLCDQLGIMVWQDFMFANMDYPAEDAQFVASVRTEATQQLQRLRRHPSVVAYCGNSEVEQQAAMLGTPRELWRNSLFGELLPELCAQLHPDSLYVPSTPSGGTLPFQTDSGVTHYYGVGAYLRPLSDVRRANVRFASECLGFANVPEKATVDAVMQGDAPAVHDPRWKQRTPRDTGAGWDFEDVRDHYLQELFGLEPMRLRYSDTARYLDLGRVTTGEIMSRVYSEWRSAYSTCGGALVWFLKDFWPGAGWGVIDSRGVPKAAFHYLRRVWQPRTVVWTDEGLGGLHAHIVNETDQPLRGTLEVLLLRDGQVVTAQATVPCDVAARAKQTFEAEAVLGAFYDTAYAYRFGPPKHDVAVATLLVDERVIAEAFHFPQSGEPPSANGAAVVAEAKRKDGQWEVTLESDRFLYAAHFDIDGFLPADNYLHLLPRRRKTIALRAANSDAKLRGFVEAVNLSDAVRIAVHE